MARSEEEKTLSRKRVNIALIAIDVLLAVYFVYAIVKALAK